LGTLLTLRGHTKTQSHIVWAEFAFFLCGALVWAPRYGIMGLAYARLASTALSAALIACGAKYLCGLSLQSLVGALFRPLLGAILSGFVAFELASHFDFPIIQIVVSGGIALLTYILWCACTWHIFGRPEGLESTVRDHWRSWRSSRLTF
jgi:hypothetical protein